MSESIECPFCGSTDINDGELLMQKTDGTRVSQSRCNGCGALGPEALTNGPDFGSVRAIAAWNRRTPQPVTPAGGEVPVGLIEALRHQDQCDEDGVMCIVSREAVDAAIKLLTQSHPPVADAALDTVVVNAPVTVDDAEWCRCLDHAEAFMPTARGAWNRFTNKPWNKHAMKRALSEFAAYLAALNQRGGGV